MSQSQIQRVKPGNINEVNDEVIGGTPVGSGAEGVSKTAGQLGMWVDLDQNMLFFNPDLGTLFPGEYQYVRLSEDQADSPAIAVGTLLYWDNTVPPSAYQVVAAADAGDEAGYVVSPVWNSGNYAYIFRYGQPESFLPTP